MERGGSSASAEAMTATAAPSTRATSGGGNGNGGGGSVSSGTRSNHSGGSSGGRGASHRSSASATSGRGGSESGTHSLSRRNSGNDGAGSGSSRDRDSRGDAREYRESRESRSSRDRDSRDSRETRSRGRSKSKDSRDHRDRDRGGGGSSGSTAASSTSASSSSTMMPHFGSSGNQAVRLRERNNMLVMHRTAMRRSALPPVEVAVDVLGLDLSYMKDPENPNLSEKLGAPGVFPTDMSHPEEKFHTHAIRNVAYVNPLPRGFGTNWHLQYSFFTDKNFPVFDEVAKASKLIERINDQENATSEGTTLATPAAPIVDHVFTAYLIRMVRRIDERISHQWMCELSSGKRTLQELVQSYGVPFKQWRPLPNVSKCPLLEYVVRYRPGYADATWFIRINVIYVEMNEIKRDSVYRRGDWFHNPRRIQRRAQGWTEQLIDYLHSLARQPNKTVPKVETQTSNVFDAAAKATASTTRKAVVQNHRHGDVGLSGGTSQPPGQPTLAGSCQLSFHEKWSYTLKLSEYQFKSGMLDGMRYVEGLLSLLQKALSPRGRNGNCSSLLMIGVNETMELVAVIQNILSEMTQYPECVMLLVKTAIQHLRYLLPPDSKIPEDLPSSLHEELVIALCQLLREVLCTGYDILVRLDENGPSSWPPYVLSNRFFDRNAFGVKEIDDYLAKCRRISSEVNGRLLRLQQLHSSAFSVASMRNEAQVIQSLDRFHRVDASVDLHTICSEVFVPFPVEATELPVDVAGVFIVCEWAVTSQRPAENRYLSALSLLEMHSTSLLEYGKENKLVDCGEDDHQIVLQGALESFLQRYKPKVITEVTHVIDLFCLLVRRRIFSVESFVEFASCVVESASNDIAVLSPNSNRPSSASGSATVVSTAYNIECAPGRGYKSTDIHLLATAERFRLYLWQFPRGPFPLPTSIPMHPVDSYDSELCLLRWLQVMDLRREHLSYSKTLERAQALSVYVFHTHGEANDPSDLAGQKDRVLKEVDYQGKVGELVSAVKTMCGHDKGRFALWFLHNVYEEASFFRFSEFGSVEHIVRLVCLILEIVDTLALLEIIIYFLGHSPVFLIKNVIIPMIERHELSFCATGQIPFLLQAFVDRFNKMSKAADDKGGNVARFFCKMYYAHAKKIGKLDLPFALIRPIAEMARKNQDANSQKQKEMSLEATNPIVRIPPPRENIPAEVKSALSRSFKALQARSFQGSEKQPVGTPLASPDSQSSQSSATEAPYEAPVYSSLLWKEIVCEATPTSENKSKDTAIDFAAAAINMSMSTSVGATNANATRERRTPNYVFFLRAILSEVMDKWMANITCRAKNNYRRPIMTPHYIHRCVRLMREVVEQHPDGEDFQEKFSNTLVVWLQKEVLPGFAGSDTQKRARNPFISMENGKEAFMLNQKGRLDKLQYGLKAFLVSLIIHKVLDLQQVLRLVLVPLFPRLRRASRDPPPNLPSQLLAIALVFQLFSEPPQNVLIEPQKLVMFDEPMTKYTIRFMRTQVPASLMFPLVHLLCQISYQMEENFTLRKREERGILASTTLFNLTSDAIVRDIIFHDTKEAREKHILPVYQKKHWHTAVLLTHFFRPPHAPAEDAPGQVQLLKVEQIMDQMNVWVLNRGGSIYLDLQMSRQQMKVKTTKKSAQQSKRKANSDIATRSSKRERVGDIDTESRRGRNTRSNGVAANAVSTQDETDASCMNGQTSDDEEIELHFDETNSATEILANLIVLRTLKKSTRPSFLGTGTVSSVSTVSTSQLFASPAKMELDDGAPKSTTKYGSNASWNHHVGDSVTGVEKSMAMALEESREASVASLYAATVCSISRRAMGSVIAKILQVLEEDVKYTQKETFARKINGVTVVRLICGVMCTPPGNAFVPRYMMSLASQLECLYGGCVHYDQNPEDGDLVFLRRLRRKLAVRLQLVAAIGQSKHVALTICYRDRIVKTLFYLLGTTATNHGIGLSLFSWIIDLIPLVNASVLHEKQFELVESLDLSPDLKRRVWTVFPRPSAGTQTAYVREESTFEFRALDPWGLLEHVPQLPSDNIVPALPEKTVKRRRVFRCV